MVFFEIGMLFILFSMHLLYVILSEYYYIIKLIFKKNTIEIQLK